MRSLRGFSVADLKMYALDVEHLTLCIGTWQAVSTAKILMPAGAAAVRAYVHQCCSQSVSQSVTECALQDGKDTS